MIGKRFEKLDRGLGEFARLLATDHQGADDLTRSQKRHDKNSSIPSADDDVDYWGRRLFDQIRNLYRGTLCRRPSNDSLVGADALLPDGTDHCLVRAMRCTKLEFLAFFVEYVDRTAIGRRQLYRFG